MRSLQVKFSALVVALLVVACVSLAVVATRHERAALEAEVEERGRSLARVLAVAAGAGIGAAGSPERAALERFVEAAAAGPGVRAVRILAIEGDSYAAAGPGAPAGPVRVMTVAAPWLVGGERVGEIQVDMDLDLLVGPAVAGSTRRISAIALTLIGFGVAAGLAFVALLVGPLRRLRMGVERLRDGDLSVRVPPTSQDELGALTRAFNEMGDALEQKSRLQSAFGRYVDDYVLNQLLEGPDDGALAGIEREVSILFCDIRGFTKLSEGMKAQEVVRLLHEVFQLTSDRILERGGTIDKFIGDSVMAYFGAPMQQDDHALSAVSAALEIMASVDERNRRVSAAGDAVPVEVGIGIHTGVVVVGNIGSDRRMDFTAVGDAVNVAHRLEKLARPGEVLVSEAVQRSVRAEYRLRFEGERQLSGRAEPVHVYSVERPSR